MTLDAEIEGQCDIREPFGCFGCSGACRDLRKDALVWRIGSAA
jgi:hypothetical protein